METSLVLSIMRINKMHPKAIRKQHWVPPFAASSREGVQQGHAHLHPSLPETLPSLRSVQHLQDPLEVNLTITPFFVSSRTPHKGSKHKIVMYPLVQLAGVSPAQ